MVSLVTDGTVLQTNDLEWYDPAALTTKDGALEITLSRKDTHNLNFQSGMMSTWNKFCFTGGLVEVSVVLPGANNVAGFWPAIWAMGNLGRAGYGASLDGMVGPLTFRTFTCSHHFSSGRIRTTHATSGQLPTRLETAFPSRLSMVESTSQISRSRICPVSVCRDARVRVNHILGLCMRMGRTLVVQPPKLIFSKRRSVRAVEAAGRFKS
jgi:hypothetical protein